MITVTLQSRKGDEMGRMDRQVSPKLLLRCRPRTRQVMCTSVFLGICIDWRHISRTRIPPFVFLTGLASNHPLLACSRMETI